MASAGTLALVVVCGVSFMTLPAMRTVHAQQTEVADQRLAAELEQVEKLRSGLARDLPAIESGFLSIAEKNTTGSSRGYAYAAIAFAYGQGERTTGTSGKIVTYCNLALEEPISAAARCECCMLLGDTLLSDYMSTATAVFGPQGFAGPHFAMARREFTVPYMRGLKTAIGEVSPKTQSPRPRVGRIDSTIHLTTESQERHRAENAAAAEASSRQDHLNRMIVFREQFINKIAFFYSRPPQAVEELEKTATEILDDRDVVKDLVGKARDPGLIDHSTERLRY